MIEEWHEEHGYRVVMMCAAFGVSKSGYYAWLKRPLSQRKKNREELLKQIRAIHEDSDGVYGAPKITKALQEKGVPVHQKRVSRLMKEHGIRSKTVRKYKQTTNSKHSLPVSENLLNQDFSATHPNQKWVTDITYCRTAEGWLYLASVLDLCTRKIVGWQVSSRMTKALVIGALKQAVHQQKPSPGLLHHSDRGSQYCSIEYQQLLQQHGMVSSTSRKGNCYDNASIESFHAIIKREMIYTKSFETRAEARRAIFRYIELFYNRKRIHGAIGYMSPAAFENTFYNNQKVA